MKTNKYFFIAMGFLTGMMFGVSIISFLAFTGGPGPVVTEVVPVTAIQAHAYVASYVANAAPINSVIKGFTIDKSQFDAMNAISRENASLTGFRIYMGVDNTMKKIGIVVGVDAAGKDAINNTIFNTDSRNLSPCPPVCDTESPISGD